MSNDKLTQRRYSGNENAWSLNVPEKNALTIRSTSTRAVTLRQLHDLGLGSDSKKSSSKTSNVDDNKQQKISKPPPGLTKSSTAKHLRNAKYKSSNGAQSKSCTQKLHTLFTVLKIQFKTIIVDLWKRNTQSNNDPYVKVSLKPAPQDEAIPLFKTLPILAGGDSVSFHPIFDESEYTFMFDKAKAPKWDYINDKYLKIEVFDYETGTSDRSIGCAHIVLKHIKKVDNEPQYATLSLFNASGSWAGHIEICALLRKIDDDEKNDIIEEQSGRSDAISTKPSLMSKFKKEKSDPKQAIEKINSLLPAVDSGNDKDKDNDKKRPRSMTDKMMTMNMNMSHMHKQKTGGTTLAEDVAKERKDREDKLKDEQTKSKTRIKQGFIINVVLFLSLILSGSLFFGVTNIYEVDSQIIFMREVHDTKFSIIDALRWSVVTTSTVGYGDFWPQTPGGKLFGSFFIIFGVSLLARLLNTVLNATAQQYEEQRQLRITHRKAVTQDNLEEFDEDGDGEITNYEFLKTMLIRRGNTTKQVIDDIMDIFARYDEDGSGFIETDEIKEQMAKQIKAAQTKERIENDNNYNETDEKTVNDDGYGDGGDDDDDDDDYKTEESDSQADAMIKKAATKLDIDLFDDGDDNDNDNKDDDKPIKTIKIELTAAKDANDDNDIDKKNDKKDVSDNDNKDDHYNDAENAFLNMGKDDGKDDNDDHVTYCLTVEVRAADHLPEMQELVEAEDSFWSFLIGWIVFIVYLNFGAMIFSYVEDRVFTDMLWFFIVTTCTVGYGDIYPETKTGKILNAFFITISVVLFVSTFSSTFDYIYARQESLVKQKELKKKEIEDMAKNYKTLWNVFPKHNVEIKKMKRAKSKQKKKKKEEEENAKKPKQDIYVPSKVPTNEQKNQETLTQTTIAIKKTGKGFVE